LALAAALDRWNTCGNIGRLAADLKTIVELLTNLDPA
jgi:hypothetical protein